jgi:tripartite-type tricarboxylate transporter receptor subunit TctC
LHTLNIGSVSSHVLAGGIYALAYDLVKDLEPVALLAFEPLMIVGRKSMPGADLKGLIAWLKANPGKASQGNPGTGSLGQVIGALFQKETGTQFQSVPYRGGGPALQDLVAGHIDLMIEPTSNFAHYIPSGAVKPYAVAARTRVSAAPQVPTVDEAELPGFYASLWLGLWLPKGTPKDIITKLNSAVIEALTDPAVRQRLTDIGQSVAPREQQTPEALGAFQKAEIEKWWHTTHRRDGTSVGAVMPYPLNSSAMLAMMLFAVTMSLSPPVRSPVRSFAMPRPKIDDACCGLYLIAES